MARGGGDSPSGELELEVIGADESMIVGGDQLARPDDEDLVRALDAAYGTHPLSERFVLIELPLAELSLQSVDEFEDPNYFCQMCADEAEDDQEIADLLAACQIERRQIIEEYRDQIAAGDELEPIVVERTDSGWRILDGYHRAAAAQASGAVSVKAHQLAC